MENKTIAEIRYAKNLNFLGIFYLGIIGAFLGFAFLPNLLQALNIHVYFTSIIVRISILIVSLFIWEIPTYFFMRHNRALVKLERKSFKAQIVWSIILCVLGLPFPLITILYVISLCFFNQHKVKEQFK